MHKITPPYPRKRDLPASVIFKLKMHWLHL
jgi:hypothetical protein